LHRIAFILAFQFAVLSTQPLWQPLKQALFGSCGANTCSTTAMACAAAPTLPGCPSGNEEDGHSAKGCCAPFQCCFPCCCYCQATTHFPDFAEQNDNARPNEDTKALHSTNLGEHFQPPEFA
jgi:hypothetical protein